MTSAPEGWEAHSQRQRRDWLSFTPEQRLEWLDDARTFASEALGAAGARPSFRALRDVEERLRQVEAAEESARATASWRVCLDALQILLREHPGKLWYADPGAGGSGPDIRSSDGTVEADVFAAVRASNNRKLAQDVRRMGARTAKHRYVFYREEQSESDRTWGKRGVIIVALPASS